MIAADLNRDHRPEIVVGYVNAPGIVYFNTGTGKKYQPVPFGDGRGFDLWYGRGRSRRRRLAGRRGGAIGRAQFCDVQSFTQEMSAHHAGGPLTPT